MDSQLEAEKELVKERVRSLFAANPRAMTMMVAQQLGICEREVVRCLPNDLSKELNPLTIQNLIRDFEAVGKVFVIVNNGAVVMEAHGQFGGFSLTGPFLNV